MHIMGFTEHATCRGLELQKGAQMMNNNIFGVNCFFKSFLIVFPK